MSTEMTVNAAFTTDENHQYENLDCRSGTMETTPNLSQARIPSQCQREKNQASRPTRTYMPIAKYILVGVVGLLVGVGIGFAAAYAVYRPTSALQQKSAPPTPTVSRSLSDKPRQCLDIKMEDPSSKSGIYSVYPDTTREYVIEVYCDMDTDEGGWLVFQRRNSGLVDFYRDWKNYTTGFGSLLGEFWLGNRKLNTLTCLQGYEIRIDLEDFDGVKRYAKYKGFYISPESDGFRLFIGIYNGTAGNSLSKHNGARFSTKDVDNDVDHRACAQTYKGAWWYKNCHDSNLNGLYLRGNHTSFANGVNWRAFKGYHHSMRTTVMSMRPLDH